jgi:hypothetical protein
MAGTGAALPRANAALANAQSLSTSLASTAAGADGASRIASSDTVGGTLWTSVSGFVQALLSGQVNPSLPSRAQMVANRVPASVTSITTSGFGAAGDGGAASYVRATGPFSDGSSFQSADGAWWQLCSPTVSLPMFGAVGGLAGQGSYGTLPDDTAAIQAAFTYAIANAIPLYVPPRHYRFTKSINAGKPGPFNGISTRIIGHDMAQSRLVADLTEAYPAIDFTNQYGALVESLGFDTTTTSLHTCGWLLAETIGTGCNSVRFNGVKFIDEGSASFYLMFGLTADQAMFDNSNFGHLGTNAAACTYFGNQNPNGITSKFYAIAASDADHTVFSSKNSNFGASTGPALWIQSYESVLLTNAYFGTQGVGGHAKGAFRVGSGTNIAGVAGTFATYVCALGMRVEENSTAATTNFAAVTASIAPTGDNMTSTMTVTATASGAIAVGQLLTGTGLTASTVVLANVSTNVWLVSNIQTVASTTITSNHYSTPAVFVEDYIYESIFQGRLDTGGAGVFGGPGSHVNSTVMSSGGGAAFNYAGALIGGRFHFSGGSLGIPGNPGSFDQTNSRNYTLGGAIGAYTTALPAVASTAGEISDFSVDTGAVKGMRMIAAETRVFAPIANTPRNYRVGVKGESGSVNAYSYTGGSGLLAFQAPTIGGAAFMNWSSDSNNDLVQPTMEFILEGQFNANWAAGGQLRIALEQQLAVGDRYQTLATLTGIPAYGTVTGFRMTVSFYYAGSAQGIYAHTKIETYGSQPVSVSSINGQTASGFDFTSSVPLKFNVYQLNSGSNPISTAVYYKVV